MEPTQAEQVAETENQQEPMPSSDQTTSAPDGSEDAAPQEVSSPEAADGLALPEDVKQRTAEQFDKLKAQLADERSRRMEAEQSFNSYYQSLSQPNTTQEPAPLYDPNTGYIYGNELENLRNTTLDANKRAERAEQKLEKYIMDAQEREAFAAYPELNYKDKDYDPSLYKATRALITDSLMNPKDYGNKELSMREAAEMAKSLQDKQVSKVRQEVKEQTLEELTPKEQASVDVRGRSEPQSNREDLAELSYRTRRGDIDSIVSRLKGIPSV